MTSDNGLRTEWRLDSSLAENRYAGSAAVDLRFVEVLRSRRENTIVVRLDRFSYELTARLVHKAFQQGSSIKLLLSKPPPNGPSQP